MSIRNNQQNKRLHQLLGDLKLSKEAKEDLVYRFTNGRSTSSASMSVTECDAMINELARNLKNSRAEKMDKMRKKIFSICHDLQWELPDGKVDQEKLNNWLMKYGFKHKPLNDYSEKELPTLVTQFENLQKSAYASARKS